MSFWRITEDKTIEKVYTSNGVVEVDGDRLIVRDLPRRDWPKLLEFIDRL